MSEKPVVTVGRKLPERVLARLSENYRPRLNNDDRLYSSEELIKKARGADALFVCHTENLNAQVIAQLPDSVRIIANFSVGYDHVDTAAAKQHGIVITNTPDVLSDATAEIMFLVLLGAARRAAEGERLVRANGWNTWSPTFMLGSQVTGKTLGIIGMGRVGQVCARRARGFDMRVLYHNRRALAAAEAGDAEFCENLEQMLPRCEFLSLHCPANEATHHLLNRERIALLPDGAVVVNTARGAVVDDDALIEALLSGKLAGAGLDVFNGEPGNIDSRYRELENVFVLPHLGSATHETRDAMGFRALDNLDAFFAGRDPRDRVA